MGEQQIGEQQIGTDRSWFCGLRVPMQDLPCSEAAGSAANMSQHPFMIYSPAHGPASLYDSLPSTWSSIPL